MAKKSMAEMFAERQEDQSIEMKKALAADDAPDAAKGTKKVALQYYLDEPVYQAFRKYVFDHNTKMATVVKAHLKEFLTEEGYLE